MDFTLKMMGFAGGWEDLWNDSAGNMLEKAEKSAQLYIHAGG